MDTHSSVRLDQYCVVEFRTSRNPKLIEPAGKGLVKMGWMLGPVDIHATAHRRAAR